ncbi:MAG: prolipoprotein diacylglyceryl transferase [Bacteroidia bacterium]|nr:prolipoprotein diacylglyceryl transferase [Bacteroidia bacterium]
MFSLVIDWNPSPEIFTIPGIGWPVRWYGLLWALALLASQYVMKIIFLREGKTLQQLDKLTMYIILGTIIGARLGHCLFYGPHFDVYDEQGNLLEEGYLSHPLNILKVYEGGLASHGGALGILISAWLFSKKEKMSYLWLMDRLVVVVPLAGMFIRFGNLMNSEIIGTPSDAPWAFRFIQVDNIPRHPSQLYEALFCLVLFGIMYWLWHKKIFISVHGTLFGLLCMLLFTERFLVEFIKENQVEFENSMTLNMGQWLSIPLVVFGMGMMVRYFFQSRPAA